MTEQQAKRLIPGQIVIYDGNTKDAGTVLGILRSGISIHWDDEKPMIGVLPWSEVSHISVWEPSN